MKNKQEILGLVANISLIALLFCFIVAGLNKIGIYSLPAQLEKLLGTYEDDEPELFGSDVVMLDAAKFDENSLDFDVVSLGYEDAKQILGDLSAVSSYSQKTTVVHSYQNKKRTEVFDIRCIGSLYSVNVSNVNGTPVKTISQTPDGFTNVSEPYGEAGEVSLRTGNFSVSDECGFVLTAEEFLNSGYELSDAEFSIFARDDMHFVSVEFDMVRNGYISRQKYVISLDYGIVTDVSSYVDGQLVYEMTTQQLSD